MTETPEGAQERASGLEREMEAIIERHSTPQGQAQMTAEHYELQAWLLEDVLRRLVKTKGIEFADRLIRRLLDVSIERAVEGGVEIAGLSGDTLSEVLAPLREVLLLRLDI